MAGSGGAAGGGGGAGGGGSGCDRAAARAGELLKKVPPCTSEFKLMLFKSLF